MQTDAIEISNLQKTFGRQPALDGLSLTFRRGERVALIGQNGAGKTTLLRCLLGQYRYTGQVGVFGLDPHRDRVALLRQAGYVPQTPPPLLMTVGELVSFALGLNPDCRFAAIEEVGRHLGLGLRALMGQTFSRLSGGTRQKVLIALALAKQPALLILDEPAANLDPAGRGALFERLRACPAAVTMLLISHRIDEVATLIHRVVELDRGAVTVDRPVHPQLAPTFAGPRGLAVAE
ncbi:MAG: ABC transporter ATP-binding protein [Candidatus Lambdaproteobacteria bacterium]|nr:ABC transporter ATP-binding protein [Candidatus Lambdaproteobacteria bacterium]